MTRHLPCSVLFLGTSLLLTGCPSDYPQFQKVDQSQLCIAETDEQAMECPEGELVMARLIQPKQDIRAFNALNTAALYCDTNHPIFENDAGIMCVLTHQRINMLTGGTPTAPSMESEQKSPSQNAAQDSQSSGTNSQ